MFQQQTWKHFVQYCHQFRSAKKFGMYVMICFQQSALSLLSKMFNSLSFTTSHKFHLIAFVSKQIEDVPCDRVETVSDFDWIVTLLTWLWFSLMFTSVGVAAFKEVSEINNIIWWQPFVYFWWMVFALLNQSRPQGIFNGSMLVSLYCFVLSIPCIQPEPMQFLHSWRSGIVLRYFHIR